MQRPLNGREWVDIFAAAFSRRLTGLRKRRISPYQRQRLIAEIVAGTELSFDDDHLGFFRLGANHELCALYCSIDVRRLDFQRLGLAAEEVDHTLLDNLQYRPVFGYRLNLDLCVLIDSD